MKTFYKLRNGLKICVDKIKRCYSTYIAINIECGAFYPQNQQIGLSHMLEHNIFFEPPHVKSLDETLGEIGTFVEANTYDFYTTYSIHTSKKHTKKCINCLMKKIFLPNFNKDFFENEKKIIYQEYLKQRNNVMPSNSFKASEKFYENSFIDNSGYGIGTKKQIDSISFDGMVNFYNKFYTMDNASIVIVGDFNKKKILRTIKKLSYMIDDTKKKTQHFTTENLNFNYHKKIEIVYTEENLLSSCVEIMFSSTNELDEKKWSYDILANMLCGLSSSSIIKRRLRTELGLIYNSDASTDPSICYTDCGTLSIRYFVDNSQIYRSIIECFNCLKEINASKYEDIFLYAKECVINDFIIKCENIEKLSLLHENELMFHEKTFNIKKTIKNISQLCYKDIIKCVDHMLSHKICIAVTGSNFDQNSLLTVLNSYTTYQSFQ